MDPAWLAALKIGLISACSLPLGTLTTLVWRPSSHIVGLLMAFGVGALIIAITLDLVHHALGRQHFWQLAVGLVIGGLLFRLLNEIVNNQGGFLRKTSTVNAYIQRNRRRRFAETARRLSHVPFFADLPSDAIEALASHVETLDFARDTPLFYAQDPSDHMYVVASGLVRILDPNEADVTLDSYGPGSAFGQLGCISGTVRLADAVVAHDSRIWVLTRESLIRLASELPSLSHHLEALINGRGMADYLQGKHGLSEPTVEDWRQRAVEALGQGLPIPSAVETEGAREDFLQQAHRIHDMPILAALPKSELEALSKILVPNRFTPGQVLVQEGQAPDRLYVIQDGAVALLDPQRPTTRSQTLKRLAAIGVFPFLTGVPHSLNVVVTSHSVVWSIRKEDFNALLKRLPVLAARVREYLRGWDVQRYLQDHEGVEAKVVSKWAHRAARGVERDRAIPMATELKRNFGAHHGAALAIWLGILLDGVPEALVIGASYSGGGHVSMSLIAGLFLSNYPEALSSSVGMRERGMSFRLVLFMWTSLMVLTGLMAALGALFFAGTPVTYLSLLEGIAAGAMLTMIAETMMPEAYSKGGATVGLATLLGFIVAIYFSTLD